MFDITISLTVAFLNSEFEDIIESSTVSVFSHINESDIVVLSSVVPFSVDPVDIESVINELFIILDVVTSELISLESFILDVVEFEVVKLDEYMYEFESMIEFVKNDPFVYELCTSELAEIMYFKDEFCMIESVKTEYCRYE